MIQSDEYCSAAPRQRPAKARLEPIVVAMKPLSQSTGPLALAEWIAVREGRPLSMISIDDPGSRWRGGTETPLVAGNATPDAFVRARRSYSDTRIRLKGGTVAETATRLAEQRYARLLVVGTGHTSGLRHGRVAHQVLRHTQVPVLIVPCEAAAHPIRHAVVAVDFSEASLRAANAVLPLLAEDGHVTLVHVQRKTDDAPSHGARPDAPSREPRFGGFIKLLNLKPGVVVTTRLLTGPVIEEMTSFLALVTPDILVCGRRNRHALPGFLLGSVTEALVRQTRMPVLVVPEPDDDTGAELLASIEWKRNEWGSQIRDFSARHMGERIWVTARDATEGAPGIVSGERWLSGMTLDPPGSSIELTLATEPTARSPREVIHLKDVAAMTLETTLGDDDRRLVIAGARGRGVIRVGDNPND